MWAKACEDVVAATASDLVRSELRPVGEVIAPHLVRKIERAVAEQVRVTRHFVRRDVRAAIETHERYPLPPGYDPKLSAHYALLNVAAYRAWQEGQVPDATVAFALMRAVLERYMQGRS